MSPHSRKSEGSRRPKRRVEADLPEQGFDGPAHAVESPGLLGLSADGSRRREVRLLQNEPAAGPEVVDQSADRIAGALRVDEDEAGVNEVEEAASEIGIADVPLDDSRVGGQIAREESRVHLDRRDRAGAAHLVCQPAEDRAGAGPDLEAAPAGSQAGREQSALRVAVAQYASIIRRRSSSS